MHQIDINLLNDRPELGTATAISQGRAMAGGDDKTPLVIGGAFAGGLVGLILLLLGGLTLFNSHLAGREQALQADLDRLAPEMKKVEDLEAKEKMVNDESKALATIFDQIKPWSATLQDLRDRVPPRLRITKIEQVAVAPPTGQPGQPTPSPSPSPAPAADGTTPPAPPPPGSELKVSGSTMTFADVNDFELTLRKSPFLKPDQTQLVSSERSLDNESGVPLVKYDLKTQLNNVDSSELVQVLNAKGASGLVSRIEVLKRQGVLKP